MPEIARGISFIFPLNQIPKSIDADEATSNASPHGLLKNVKTILVFFWSFMFIESMFCTLESFENAAANEPPMLMLISMVHKLMPNTPTQQTALDLGFVTWSRCHLTIL